MLTLNCAYPCVVHGCHGRKGELGQWSHLVFGRRIEKGENESPSAYTFENKTIEMCL